MNEELKKELIKILLEVYTNDKQVDRASSLLNAQAMNLDVLDVCIAVFCKDLFADCFDLPSRSYHLFL